MAALTIVLQVIWLLAAVTIVVSVLLHAAKGDGVAAIGGQAQLFASQKSAEKNLDRISWGAVATFMLLSVLLSSKWFLSLG